MGSANPPQDMDTTATDTTTARKSPKRLATTFLLSPPLSPLSRLPTLSQSRPVSTNQSPSQESAVRTSQKRNVSPSQKLKTPPKHPRNALPSLLLQLARLLNFLFPSRSARRSTTDTLKILMKLNLSHMLLPPLLMLPKW